MQYVRCVKGSKEHQGTNCGGYHWPTAGAATAIVHQAAEFQHTILYIVQVIVFLHDVGRRRAAAGVATAPVQGRGQRC